MKTGIFLSLILLSVSAASQGETLAQSLAAKDPNYDTSWYVGAAVGGLHYRQNNISEFKLGDRRLIFGKQLNRAIAAEVHLGNSSGDTKLISGVPVTLKVDNYVAGFIKLNLTFQSRDWNYNRFRVYGMLGGTRIATTSSDPGYTGSGVQTSLAGGVGMEFFLDNLAIQLGYTRYVSGNTNNQKYTLDSLHLGVIYQFGEQVANAN